MSAPSSFVANGHLADGFLRSAHLYPDRTALVVDDERLTYAQLASTAAAIAGALGEHKPDGGPSRTAVLGERSVGAFAGVLGTLLRGDAYVPLNPTFPATRNQALLSRTRCRALVVDRGSLPHLDGILAGAEEELLIVAPELEDVSDLRSRWRAHTVIGATDLPEADPPDRLQAPAADASAYLLFTSGSTGTPKGVVVAHRNVVHFIRAITERYNLSPEDRVSQTFALTFDLSVFDMFVTWEAGAALHCLPSKALLKPGAYIREHELTMWFSVPSTAMFMRRFGELKTGAYPSLRWSLFAGEALPVEVAEAWAEAAPHSIVENLYGPTEATIACTVYRWNAQRPRAEFPLGIVPIGRPTPAMHALVVDPELNEVPAGVDGELLVAGPQVTPGYLDDPARTEAAFVVPPGRSDVYYRTGDRVRLSAGGDLHYIGRMDHQIQVLGHRVELGEIECAARAAAGVDSVAALGWPRTAAGAAGIVLFVAAPEVDVKTLHTNLAAHLPEYMVPRTIHVLSELPLNPSGKIDRRALEARLAERA